MKYGYCRCSTSEEKQDVNRQVMELKKMGITDEKYIYKEYISGTSKNKPELEKLKAIVVAGDTICATEPSRLTRSTKQLCDIIDFCKDNHLRLELGNFVVDCTKELDPMTEGMLKMMGVFSEIEKNMISTRVKSGMENARLKGKKIGRAKTTMDNIPKEVLKNYEFYKSSKIDKSTFARMCGVTRQSIYKYIKIIEENGGVR
ncbi:MAG: recombinase family protein [Clostridium butyricum]|nr:recombinase family protein [Clostridium butyricum]